MNFRDLLNKPIQEEADSSELGFESHGKIIDIYVHQGRHNSMMSLELKGNKILARTKSNEDVQDEKAYKEVTKKYSHILEKLNDKFEKDLLSLIDNFSKEVKDL